MIYLLYILNFLLMIAMPLGVALYLQRKRRPGWGLFGMGAVTFVVSQVFHIPFNVLIQNKLAWLPTDLTVLNNLLLVAGFLGLSAGVFEEVARYITYRFWAVEARSWGKGLMLGAGHGGIEAILLGVLGLLGMFQLWAVYDTPYWHNLPDSQLLLLEQQVTAVFEAPWYFIFLGALERVFAICFHLAASLLVWQVFVRRQTRWLLAAIGWHALLDALAVFAVVTWGPYVTEAILGIFTVGSVGIIFWLRREEPAPPQPEPLPDRLPIRPAEITSDMLDRSRYS